MPRWRPPASRHLPSGPGDCGMRMRMLWRRGAACTPSTPSRSWRRCSQSSQTSSLMWVGRGPRRSCQAAQPTRTCTQPAPLPLPAGHQVACAGPAACAASRCYCWHRLTPAVNAAGEPGDAAATAAAAAEAGAAVEAADGAGAEAHVSAGAGNADTAGGGQWHPATAGTAGTAAVAGRRVAAGATTAAIVSTVTAAAASPVSCNSGAVEPIPAGSGVAVAAPCKMRASAGCNGSMVASCVALPTPAAAGMQARATHPPITCLIIPSHRLCTSWSGAESTCSRCRRRRRRPMPSTLTCSRPAAAQREHRGRGGAPKQQQPQQPQRQHRTTPATRMGRRTWRAAAFPAAGSAATSCTCSSCSSNVGSSAGRPLWPLLAARTPLMRDDLQQTLWQWMRRCCFLQRSGCWIRGQGCSCIPGQGLASSQPRAATLGAGHAATPHGVRL